MIQPISGNGSRPRPISGRPICVSRTILALSLIAPTFLPAGAPQQDETAETKGRMLTFRVPFGLVLVPAAAQAVKPDQKLTIFLDDRGVANFALTNPRSPVPLHQNNYQIDIENRTFGTIFLVKIPLKLKQGFFTKGKLVVDSGHDYFQKSPFEVIEPYFFTKDIELDTDGHYQRDGSGNPKIRSDLEKEPVKGTVQFTVFPGTGNIFRIHHQILDEILRYLSDKTQLMVLEVEVFNEDRRLAQSKAYFQVGPGLNLPTEFKWKVSASIAMERAPELARENPDLVYGKERTDRIPGSGNLFLTANVGAHLIADLNLKLYKGVKGDQMEDKNEVEAASYSLSYFSEDYWHFKFGKFDLATPSSKIAVNESGEGLALLRRRFQFGYLIKRESAAGVANQEDRDNEVWLLQHMPTGNATITALYGKNEEHKTDEGLQIPSYDYWTAGAELFWRILDPEQGTEQNGTRIFHSVNGSLGGYLSDRHVKRKRDEPSNLRDGEGFTALAELTYTRLARVLENGSGWKSKNNLILNLAVGFGSGGGDDTLDKGYIGETASFAPDSLFLKSLAAELSVHNEASAVAKGLSNKWYYGLKYTRPTYSPLELLLRAFEEKIPSQSFTFAIHHYQVGELGMLPSGKLGWEASFATQVEAPKGVKTSFTLAYFDPGRAIQRFFDKDPWAASLQFSVTLSQ